VVNVLNVIYLLEIQLFYLIVYYLVTSICGKPSSKKG